MELTNSEIKQFQQLYKANFGVDIDNNAARNGLLKLVQQMHIVYRQITPEELAAYEAKNESVNEDTNDEQTRATSNS